MNLLGETAINLKTSIQISIISVHERAHEKKKKRNRITGLRKICENYKSTDKVKSSNALNIFIRSNKKTDFQLIKKAHNLYNATIQTILFPTIQVPN